MNCLRSIDEIKVEREKWRRQALECRHEKQRVEAMACALIVGTLSWVLGETSSPTIRVKLD
jgi:hypothetical protein